MRGKGFFTSTTVGSREDVRWWPLPDGESRLIGIVEHLRPLRPSIRSGTPLAYALGTRRSTCGLSIVGLCRRSSSPRIRPTSRRIVFHPDGQSIAAIDKSGEVRIWPTSGKPTGRFASWKPSRCADFVTAREAVARGRVRGRHSCAHPALGPDGAAGRGTAGASQRLDIRRRLNSSHPSGGWPPPIPGPAPGLLAAWRSLPSRPRGTRGRRGPCVHIRRDHARVRGRTAWPARLAADGPGPAPRPTILSATGRPTGWPSIRSESRSPSSM